MIKWNFPSQSQMLAGIDIPIEGIGITMRFPRVKEILMMGEDDYLKASQIFQLDKHALGVMSEKADSWTILTTILNDKKTGKETRRLLQNYLALFFTDKVAIGPNSIIIMRGENMINIEAKDFDDFKVLLSKLNGLSLFQLEGEQFNPKNKLAAEIAEKMRKARAKLAKVKQAEQGGSKKNKGFLWQYLKYGLVNGHISWDSILNMTVFQLHIMVQTGLAKESYELDVQSRLAGAKNDKPLKHWLTVDYDDDENLGTV